MDQYVGLNIRINIFGPVLSTGKSRLLWAACHEYAAGSFKTKNNYIRFVVKPELWKLAGSFPGGGYRIFVRRKI
jgi:hypothetical protein